jgi:glycosyltransferase involved in cell wall biosynthesis
MNKYVLLTPAKNEELNIGKTIESVVSQLLGLVKRVIISDDSIDSTEEIVQSHYCKCVFIHF